MRQYYDLVKLIHDDPSSILESCNLMALKSTVYKAELQLSDIDRNYYAAHSLIMARHPSETDERMMVRLLAFALNANEHLVFAKGLSDIDEPDIWLKDYTGAIKSWIEVGQPDERRLLKACGRAEQVIVYSYASNSAIWWQGMGNRLERAKNLTIWNVPVATSQALEKMVQRAMLLQSTIQDGQLWLTDGEQTVQVDLVRLKEGSNNLAAYLPFQYLRQQLFSLA